MRFTRTLIQCRVFGTLYRHSSSTSSKIPFVKVISTKEDETVKISFKYAHFPSLTLTALKTETVQTILTRIKRMAELQRKYSFFSKVAVVDEKKLDVCLIQDDSPLDESTPNGDAWTLASGLKIGDTVYEIKYNTPVVTSLTLPDYIVAGCYLRPHVFFESASLKDSVFSWYRSLNQEEASELTSDGRGSEILVESEKCWLKVGEGLLYQVSSEVAGHFLKVVCTPKQEDLAGFDCSIVSKAVVESAPEIFPFEERQTHTQTFTDDDSVRCVSYNMLANVYVEKRKYPYTTRKARDFYYRKQILLKELIGYKSDVICLQECQERVFEMDLAPVLKQSGYHGFYRKKGGGRNEGLATFVYESKYKILKNYGILLNLIIKEKHIFMDLITKVAGNYKDMSKLLAQDTALQVLLLEHVNQPEKKLLVANTHLYSNKDTPEVRLIQAAVCTYYIDHFVKIKDLQSVPVLFCGDFNSLPDSNTYNFMMSGNYKCCPSWQNNSDTDIDTVLRHNLCLDSACGVPEYTNYTKEFQGCLDYIFYSKNHLEVCEVVPMPPHEQVTANVALPSELFPSDHIALVCTLQWKNS